MYQLLFNNLTFDLSSVEMTSFANYLDQIDIDYWETEYKYSIYEKKIPIPTLQSNFIILLNRKELEELRYLVDCINEYKILKPFEINYLMVSN
ncbi:hypothetical protein DB891_08225 [Flavobacterium laiguense]|uniref:Uncharacterized protein n=2 Tax=Flavobacterium laiguense TaxID=2169409 RepID=A0A2U1JXI0_9FLAO|nr:hypothetical protein DB891_08225 [Flavobacterium laiguense]